MPQRYFDKFPTITYSNSTVVDITKRTSFIERVSSNPYIFYPYEITSNERPDQLSTRYYDDPFRSWILYLTNKIVDPYYEWYMHDKEFVDFITKKYGSYYEAQTKVKHYRNNWVQAEKITSSQYNALTSTLKQYWDPIFGYNNRINSYQRKQLDWLSTTNKVVEYRVSNTNFVVDEICDIVFDAYSMGKGQVVSINTDSANTANSIVCLQHVSGSYIDNDEVSILPTSHIQGTQSNVNTVFTEVNLIVNNFSAEEEIYWSPVTYLEFETEKNEFNKTIRVLDSEYKQTIVDNLKELMKE